MNQTATVEDLRTIERLIGGMSGDDRKALGKLVSGELAKKWQPNPGPQTMAMNSLADELLYGGQGGGGKSELLLGLAFTTHKRTLIIRRQYTDLRALTERAVQINGSRAGFNGSPPPTLRTGDGRLIEFGACAHLGDEHHWQGQPHDLLGIDEAAQLAESQVRFFMGWVRTVDPAQRCRVVLATNPPLGSEGEYLVGMFAPWLDPEFSEPARAGELRWYIYDPKARRDRWVEGPGEFVNDTAETVHSRSRTFIPASVKDNPDLIDTGYHKTLDSLPEPLRSAVRDGNFMAARQDDEFQVIPSDWIRQAQQRWRPDGFKGLKMTALGVDVAQGGMDETTLAPRYGTWFAELIVRPGAETPDSPSVAGLISMHRRDGAAIVIDVGGGYGGGVVSYLKDNEMPATGFNAAHASTKRTQDGQLGFVNKRAEAHWRLREALDPGQAGGSPIALPPHDGKLAADLAAPRWKLTPRGIQIESKDEIRERLGRSPDRGDAAVISWSEGEALAMRKHLVGSNHTPKVNVGHAAAKRHRR